MIRIVLDGEDATGRLFRFPSVVHYRNQNGGQHDKRAGQCIVIDMEAIMANPRRSIMVLDPREPMRSTHVFIT